MKICPKCGVTQDDKRTVCVDCGAVLDFVSDAKAEQTIREQSKKISGMADRSDIFYLGKINIVCIVVQSIFLVTDIVLMFINRTSEVAALFLVFALICAAAIIISAFPKLIWNLQKLKLIFFVDTSNLTPTAAYDMGYKIIIIFLSVSSALLTFYTLTLI